MKTHKLLPELSPHQQQIIDGSLLGDGTLKHNKINPLWNWSFQKFQSYQSKDGSDKKNFMTWHKESLVLHSASLECKNRVSLLPDGRHFSHLRYEFKTHVHPIWTALGKKWYLHDRDGNLVYNDRKQKIKIIPRDLKLTPLSTCIWFMDDGNNYAPNGNAMFCTQGFSVQDVDFLVDRLKVDLGIQCKMIMKTGKHYTSKKPAIYVGRKGYFDLMDCIRPHVEWECFSYKVDTSAYKKKSRNGENHHNSKLREEDVRRIFSMRDEGLQHKQIAEKFGISSTTICLILNGKLWSHLGLSKGQGRICKRMSPSEKEEALVLLRHGWFEKDIASKFEVSQATISRLKHGGLT